MATRKGTQQPPASSKKIATKQIIYADDTSGTISIAKNRRSDSTTISLNESQEFDSYEIDSKMSSEKAGEDASGAAILKWVKDHWAILTALLVLTFSSSIFITKLDSKVDVLNTDVKDVKVSIDKLKTETTRTATLTETIQHALGRIEDSRARQIDAQSKSSGK